jgi:hypothetical protein
MFPILPLRPSFRRSFVQLLFTPARVQLGQVPRPNFSLLLPEISRRSPAPVATLRRRPSHAALVSRGLPSLSAMLHLSSHLGSSEIQPMESTRSPFIDLLSPEAEEPLGATMAAASSLRHGSGRARPRRHRIVGCH